LDYIGIYVEENQGANKIIYVGKSLADAMKIAVIDNNQALYQK